MSKPPEAGAPASFEDIPLEAYDEFAAFDEEFSTGDTASPLAHEDPFDIPEVNLDEVAEVVHLEPVSGSTQPASSAPATNSANPVELDPVMEFLRSLEGEHPSEVAKFLDEASFLLDDLAPSNNHHPLAEVFSVLSFAASVDDTGIFRYANIDLSKWSSKVRSTVEELLAMEDVPRGPSAALANLELTATRKRLLEPAQKLVAAIQRKAPLAEVELLAKRIQIKDLSTDNSEFDDLLRTAHEWKDHAASRNATVDRIRLATGWPHLDLTQTAPGGVPGFFSPGHLAGFVAPSGHGKSTFVRELLRNLALDLRNWGMPSAKVLAIIVEEEPERVVEATRLAEEYSEAGEQVAIAKVNSSRRRFGAAFLKSVVEAAIESEAAGQPVREFMPAVLLLDYLQEIVEQGENAYVDAIDKTTGLLRGIAECDLDEIEKFADIRWTDVAPSGMKWPSGLDDHRVAVVATAQVKSLDEKTLYYRKGLQIDEFVVRDPRTNEPLWEVRPGDHRVIRRGDIAGSKKFLNNLSNLVFLHRSNVRGEKEKYTKVLPDGSTVPAWRLSDTRARFIFEKIRYGSAAPVVPMAFSSAPDGRSAKWYDYRAEEEAYAELQGRRTARNWDWDWDRSWYDPAIGGPILPLRPRRNPAEKITY